MLLSIIVPLYKGEKYINRIIHLIENNRNIDCLNTEIVFVNDYPEDVFKTENYSSQLNIKFLNHKKNRGIHQTKIEGFQESKGEYILFLDQDDTITDYYFESQINTIGDKDAVFCNGYCREGENIFDLEKMQHIRFNLQGYMLWGYLLISLGQMLIRREAVPVEWIKNPLINNGWDDHLFWVCLLHENASIVYNDNFLYIHEEAGDNASFHWTAMKKSGSEFREKICGLNIFDKNQELEFATTIEKRLQKYDRYMELDQLLESIDAKKIQEYIHRNSIQNVAIYGIGVYGKKLIQILSSQEVHIRYGIDKNARKKKMNFPVYEDIKQDIHVDCIICATGFDDENVKTSIKGYCKAITLRDFLLSGSVHFK